MCNILPAPHVVVGSVDWTQDIVQITTWPGNMRHSQPEHPLDILITRPINYKILQQRSKTCQILKKKKRGILVLTCLGLTTNIQWPICMYSYPQKGNIIVIKWKPSRVKNGRWSYMDTSLFGTCFVRLSIIQFAKIAMLQSGSNITPCISWNKGNETGEHIIFIHLTRLQRRGALGIPGTHIENTYH